MAVGHWRGWGDGSHEVRVPIPFLRALAEFLILVPLFSALAFVRLRKKGRICAACQRIDDRNPALPCTCGGACEPSYFWKWQPVTQTPWSAQQLETWLNDTEWEWWEKETVVFRPAGLAEWHPGSGRVGAWKIKDAAQRIIEGTSPGGAFRLVLEEDLRRGLLTEGRNPPREITPVTA